MKKIVLIMVAVVVIILQPACSGTKGKVSAPAPVASVYKEAEAFLRRQTMESAAWAMKQAPVTVTSETSPRSAGNKHDFFSEADYFWPDPANPSGRYIERDGLTNPDNFVAHRQAMIRFSKIIGALAAAYRITGDDKYVQQAVLHLKAWFTDTTTMMNPNLQYAQAVKGLVTGRNYGIIDTIHFIEVAQGVWIMQGAAFFDAGTLAGIKEWFRKYIYWLNNSKPGIAEKNVKNNHSTCWAMQVASFARLCDDKAMMDSCRNLYRNILLPRQMGEDGSFPLEMARTKPFGYAIFNLDAMVTLCQVLSVPGNDLWMYATPDGRSIRKGIEFLYPFIADKSKWPLKPDVMYWNDWPVAQPFLLFGASQYNQRQWLDTWKQLDHQPTVEEVIRNLPVRNPLIWL